jgi:hypothetical protein
LKPERASQSCDRELQTATTHFSKPVRPKIWGQKSSSEGECLLNIFAPDFMPDVVSIGEDTPNRKEKMIDRKIGTEK